jgi:hypothetical protein
MLRVREIVGVTGRRAQIEHLHHQAPRTQIVLNEGPLRHHNADLIGAEFIMSRGGMGCEISFAYNNFDNATMYPLILLILLVSITINMLLARWEKRLMIRRGQR